MDGMIGRGAEAAQDAARAAIVAQPAAHLFGKERRID